MKTVGVESPGDELAVAADRETMRLYAWRLAELSRAGYDDDAGSLLAARSDVDLHRACDLPRRGCSIELALRILL